MKRRGDVVVVVVVVVAFLVLLLLLVVVILMAAIVVVETNLENIKRKNVGNREEKDGKGIKNRLISKRKTKKAMINQ